MSVTLDFRMGRVLPARSHGSSAGRPRLSLLVAALLGASIAACNTPPPAPPPALPDHGPAPSVEADPLGARIHELGLARLRRLSPEGTVIRGTLRTSEVEDHPFVLLGTHCYAFVGVGGAGVEDLDLILTNPMGASVKHDESMAKETDLGISNSICPEEPGMFKVRVRMFRGQGDYALRMFSHQVI